MKSKKKALKIAKTLFKTSLSNGFIDNTKVKQNLNMLVKDRPYQLVNILRLYKRLIAQKEKTEELLVESADKLPEKDKKMLQMKTKTKKVVEIINPKLVFGTKITHGDWIYELTLDSKLNQLISNST